MGHVNITLNGKNITTDSNKTILEVARENGIFIPTLCHDNRLEPYGSCRVCLVKVKGARTYLPSCSTKVMDGMVIDTEAPDVKNARKMSLSLLVSDHFGDCVSPCSQRCPANIDIQGYIALIADKKYQEAVKLIKEKLPMPLSIGRICPHPCESVCRRNKVEEPIAINNLKRFVADYDLSTGNPYIPEKEPSKGKKVAIVGSGPAGLTAAYFLAVKGYDVTIFEREEKAGGMLRYGIPEYRLPKDILDKEIELILSLGINIEYSKELGKDFTVDDLKKQGYSAVFLGLGAQKSMNMRVEGEDTEGVESGIGFLHRVAEKRDMPDLKGKKVIVVGGGNTAMDAARTSLRLGASEVLILYRRTKKEMPANDYEIEEAEEEGIKFKFLSAPIKISKGQKGLNVECINMKLGEPDTSGRRRPIPIEGSNYTMQCDLLIKAIGQRPDLSSLTNEKLVSERNRLMADPETGTTSDPFIFGGGDCVIGAATAVEAIAGGRKAAYSIDQYLTTGKVNPYSKEFIISKGKLEEIPDEFFSVYERENRVKMPTLAVEDRIQDFRQIELGLSEEQALKEAKRCLECGCNEGFSCKLRDNSTEYNVKEDDFKGAVNHFPDFNNMTANHPVILREPNKCIKCGICVRYCDEIKGLGVFGFVKRGFETEISPYFYHELAETSCDFCGGCADACPTGALSINPFTPKPGPFKTETVSGKCIHCSLHCDLEYKVYENSLIRVSAVNTNGENDGSLCVRGRYEYEYLKPENRETNYLFIKGSLKNKFDKNRAIERAVEFLKTSKKTAVITSTNLSNEEYENIHRLASIINGDLFHIPFDTGEGTNHLENGICLTGKSSYLKTTMSGLVVPSLDEIETSDQIVVFNAMPARNFPILEIKIRKAVRKGSLLFTINDTPIQIESISNMSLRFNRRYFNDFISTLGSLIVTNSNVVDEEAKNHFSSINTNNEIAYLMRIKPDKLKSFALNLLKSKNPVFIIDEDRTDIEILENFIFFTRLFKNAKLLPLSKGMNPAGALKYKTKNSNSTFTLDSDILRGYDTLILMKTPWINTESTQNIIHIDFKPLENYGGNAVFMPASSILETGGEVYNYMGNAIRIEKLLNAPESVDNSTELLNNLIQKL